MELDTIGIDLGKTTFHAVGLNPTGEVAVRRKLSRLQLLRFTANLRVRLICMEACGLHFLGRSLREQGHEVRLMPAQYVKTNKNDYIDAEAIAEAVGRPRMRFVPIKSDDQLDMQSLHHMRDRWVAHRTSVINQIRGLLLERDITFRKGRRHAEASLPGVMEDPDNGLSGSLRMLLALVGHARLPTQAPVALLKNARRVGAQRAQGVDSDRGRMTLIGRHRKVTRVLLLVGHFSTLSRKTRKRRSSNLAPRRSPAA